MTPASREPINSSAFFMPDSVDVIDVIGGSLLAWGAAPDAAEITFRGGDDLLPAFIDLATAEPAEMGEFLTDYGIVELCQHGQPDRHPDKRRTKAHCPLITLDDGRPAIASEDLRRASLAFGAAQQASLSLSARQLPDPSAWDLMSRLQIRVDRQPLDTWQQGRQALAMWLTGLLSDCGVSTVADWSGPRLNVTNHADGLFGSLALLLARELGQGDAYTCDICNGPVDRIRPPKAGEGVYCDKPKCKREQQRRNQAAWRARKREESTNGE